MGTEVKLINGPGISNYTNFEDLSKFPNLKFVSLEGHSFSLNRAVFAACSKLGDILTEDNSVICTPFSTSDLGIVLNFVLTGCIPFGIKTQTARAFACLGVNLVGLKFSKVNHEDVPKCRLKIQSKEKESLDKEQLKQHPLVHISNRKRSINSNQIVLIPGKVPRVELQRSKVDIEVSRQEKVDRPQIKNIDELNPVTKAISKHKSATQEELANRLDEDYTAFTKRNQDLKYQCLECFFGTNFISMMREHTFRHENATPSNNLFFFCSHCAEGYSEMSEIVSHVCTQVPSLNSSNVPEDCLSQEDIDTLKRREKYAKVFVDINPKQNESVFLCNICKLVFGTNIGYFSHRTHDHKIKPPNIEALKEEFKTSGLREVGLKYDCKLCLFATNNSKRMFQHEMRHEHSSTDNGIFYFCEHCQQGYQFLNQCVNHETSCKDRTAYMCRFCKKDFDEPLLCMHHMKECEYSQVPTQCVQCGRISKSKRIHEKHMQTMGPFHLEECNQCKAEMSSYDEYLNHVSAVHEDVMKYTCGLCNLVFNSKDEQINHR